MCPFQRRCRHRENGKAGSPADLTCWVVKPERATAFFTLTVFYSTYFRILEKKRSLKQLFGKMAVTTILFKTSISRIPLLLFGQHQVPSQLTQHLRCSDPDRFSTNYKLCFPLLALQCISQWSSGYLPKMLFTKKHNYKTETTNTTLPSPNCCPHLPNNSNTRIQSCGNSTS